ncbi:hypothetical protein EVA_14936 [gut metagenome]|uniref:Uncharacterized protein n=1 Tax=gut metagenome TaxID=749906 RepID=J9FPS4_9ZZZZ
MCNVQSTTCKVTTCNVQCAMCNVQSYKSIVQPYCKIAYFLAFQLFSRYFCVFRLLLLFSCRVCFSQPCVPQEALSFLQENFENSCRKQAEDGAAPRFVSFVSFVSVVSVSVCFSFSLFQFLISVFNFCFQF